MYGYLTRVPFDISLPSVSTMNLKEGSTVGKFLRTDIQTQTEKNMASSAKGAKHEFEISIALWIDLLGYGKMLEDAAWDPTSPIAKAALNRIVQFQNIASKHSMRNFPTFVMNDGVIAFRDLSPRTNAVTFDFLSRAIELHTAINQADIASGHPGARAVVAVGFRVRRQIDYSMRLNNGEGKVIKEKFNAGLMSQTQAINHALMARHHCDSTPELQHNYAMTKAYLADASGSKAGFIGPGMFVDMSMFNDAAPSWINFSKIIPWAARGMSAEFGHLNTIDQRKADICKFEGLLGAFDVAARLSPNPDVLQVIRNSRLGDLRKPAP